MSILDDLAQAQSGSLGNRSSRTCDLASRTLAKQETKEGVNTTQERREQEARHTKSGAGGRPAPPDMSTVHKTPKYGSKEDVFTGSGYLWASVLQDASWPWHGPSVVFCVTLPFICESAILLQPFIAITTGARPDQ